MIKIIKNVAYLFLVILLAMRQELFKISQKLEKNRHFLSVHFRVILSRDFPISSIILLIGDFLPLQDIGRVPSRVYELKTKFSRAY